MKRRDVLKTLGLGASALVAAPLVKAEEPVIEEVTSETVERGVLPLSVPERTYDLTNIIAGLNREGVRTVEVSVTGLFKDRNGRYNRTRYRKLKLAVDLSNEQEMENPNDNTNRIYLLRPEVENLIIQELVQDYWERFIAAKHNARKDRGLDPGTLYISSLTSTPLVYNPETFVPRRGLMLGYMWAP